MYACNIYICQRLSRYDDMIVERGKKGWHQKRIFFEQGLSCEDLAKACMRLKDHFSFHSSFVWSKYILKEDLSFYMLLKLQAFSFLCGGEEKKAKERKARRRRKRTQTDSERFASGRYSRACRQISVRKTLYFRETS